MLHVQQIASHVLDTATGFLPAVHQLCFFIIARMHVGIDLSFSCADAYSKQTAPASLVTLSEFEIDMLICFVCVAVRHA